MTDYFGGQTSYSYDALGRLTSLSNPFGEVTTFQYDANSRLIRKNLANGTYTTYSYNSRGFLTGIYNYKSNGTLLTYATYTYDAVGNRLSMSTPEGNYTYSYDAIYRLTGEVNPIGGTYSYTYDAVGNRLSMTHNGQTISYVYDAGNKLLQARNTTFTYDGNGNMVSKTENGQTTTYVYNYEDKMVQVNLPNGSIVYSYDHSGKRIAKTAGGATIDYYFDGDDLIAEAQGANILAYYTQGSGLISQRRNNASYFYHYDGLGSTKALTDANQNIQNTTKYDAWGNILQSSGTITNPYLYVGELGYYGDGDAGMYLLTQRWYNPVVGRFVVRDENQRHRTLYPYLYTIDNPINYIDPLGWERCPNPNELPAESYRIIKSCAQNCFQKFHPSFQQTGDINNSYLKDFAQCVFKCTKGKLEDLGIDFVCCFWWWKVKGGEDATKDPLRVHPCSEDWLNRSGAEAANCQSCCDFKWCECIMHYAKGLKDVIKGFIKCTLAGRTACYLSCDACFSPYFPK